MDYIFEIIFFWTVLIAIIIFIITSIVLFIKDGKLAKRESRKRKKKYTVMFIISMTITGLALIFTILLFILASIAMRSM